MLNNLKKKRKGKGFTLIELIIVIAIIAIISAIAVPKLLQSKKDADTKADFANAKTIANAYLNAVGEGTTDPTGLGAVAGTGLALSTSANDAVVALRDKLQGVPTTNTPKGKTFYVVLAIDGGIQVWNATTEGTAKGADQLFPIIDPNAPVATP